MHFHPFKINWKVIEFTNNLRYLPTKWHLLIKSLILETTETPIYSLEARDIQQDSSSQTLGQGQLSKADIVRIRYLKISILSLKK